MSFMTTVADNGLVMVHMPAARRSTAVVTGMSFAVKLAGRACSINQQGVINEKDFDSIGRLVDQHISNQFTGCLAM